MTKDVLVSISGLQMDMMDMEGEPIEVITPASYYCKNGKHYVIYDEIVEGIPEVIKNKIKITDYDVLEIMKTGVTSTHMIFEKDKKNLTYYGTPFGQMLVGVSTKRMDISYDEDCIDVQVDYQLDVNHEPVADCQIRMNIASKGKKNFSELTS